jgi:hypothetical protein
MRRAILLLAACSSRAAAPPGPEAPPPVRAVDAAVAPDATPEDVVFRDLFPLGDQPAVPALFGGLRPWMPAADAAGARPAAWGDAWSAEVSRLVDVGALVSERYNHVHYLWLAVDVDDGPARLRAAWGEPALHRDETSVLDAQDCWLGATTRIRACALANLDGDFLVRLSAYSRLDELLAAGGRFAPDTLAGFIGKRARDVIAAYPERMPETMGRRGILAVYLPATEAEADAGPDHAWFYLGDDDETVESVALGLHFTGEARRAAVVEPLRAWAERLAGRGYQTRVDDDDTYDAALVIWK